MSPVAVTMSPDPVDLISPLAVTTPPVLRVIPVDSNLFSAPPPPAAVSRPPLNIVLAIIVSPSILAFVAVIAAPVVVNVIPPDVIVTSPASRAIPAFVSNVAPMSTVKLLNVASPAAFIPISVPSISPLAISTSANVLALAPVPTLVTLPVRSPVTLPVKPPAVRSNSLFITNLSAPKTSV